MLPGTLAAVAYLAEVRPLIPPAERAWILVAEQESNALLRAGDLRSATRQLHAIHDQVQARAAADPANTEWQRDLSVSHEQAGGRGGGGRGPGRGPGRLPGLPGHPDRLAAADPANTEWQRDLSISHERLGDVAVAAGDLAAARAAYQAGLDIARAAGRCRPGQHRMAARPVHQPRTAGGRGGGGRGPGRGPGRLPGRAGYPERLAAADPANTGWQRDLSVSHEKLGDVAAAAGDLTAARTAYQASLDIAERLAAANPANTGWQRDLSVSHNKLGDVAAAAGDLTAARTTYQASLDIANGWPPPTPPTPDGSATCPSATTS